MPKEKDYSTKLVDLIMEEEFKLFMGNFENAEIAGMASQDDKYFDTYGAGKIFLVNETLTEDERRIAIATILKEYKKNYKESGNDFYIEVKKEELDATKVLDILINGEAFDKRNKKLENKLPYNERIMQLSKEFYVKPSLVAKYTKTR